MAKKKSELDCAVKELQEILDDEDASDEQLRDAASVVIYTHLQKDGPPSIKVNLKKLYVLLTEWHRDEATDTAKARQYAERLIQRIRATCEVKE